MGRGAQLFLITAAATFIGGIALALVQPWLLPQVGQSAADPDKVVSVTVEDQFGLDGLAQARIAKNIMDRLEYREIEQVGEIDFGFATIKNEGEVDITDFEAKLISRVAPDERDFLAAGYLRESDYGIEDTIPVDVGDGREVVIPIDLLKTEESLTVWFVMSQNNMAVLQVREPNISVLSDVELIRRSIESDRSNQNEQDDPIADWVFILIFVVAAFTAGAGLTVAAYDGMLKKVGFEPKELIAAFEEQVKKEKETKKEQ